MVSAVTLFDFSEADSSVKPPGVGRLRNDVTLAGAAAGALLPAVPPPPPPQAARPPHNKMEQIGQEMRDIVDCLRFEVFGRAPEGAQRAMEPRAHRGWQASLPGILRVAS